MNLFQEIRWAELKERLEDKVKDDPGPERRRHKSMSSVGRVLENEVFTQVETATGSGRKITIKCGDKSKLKSKDIIDLLDDEADEHVKKVSVTPTKKVATARARRASVSCTTPAKTPTKKLQLKRKETSGVFIIYCKRNIWGKETSVGI